MNKAWIIPIREKLVTSEAVTDTDIKKGWEDPHTPGAARSLGVADSEGRTIFAQSYLDQDAAVILEGVKVRLL